MDEKIQVKAVDSMKKATITLNEQQIRRLMKSVTFYDKEHGETKTSTQCHNKLFTALWRDIKGDIK